MLNDQSGTYRDISGPYGVECTRQAVAEFGNKGFNVEVIFADHQNKPDVGVNIARQWYDQGVDLILDVPTSSVGLAVNNVAREKNKAYINTGSATSDLTGAQCSPNTVHWMYDTYMLAKSTGGAMVKAGRRQLVLHHRRLRLRPCAGTRHRQLRQGGGRQGERRGALSLPGDLGFQQLPVAGAGPRAPRSSAWPMPAPTPSTASSRRPNSASCRRGAKLAALLMFLPDVHALGLQTAQGLVLTESFYWDLNDRTRAVTERLKPRLKDIKPNMASIANYSAALHYLKAVADMGVAASKVSGIDVVNRMKAMPCDDDAFGAGPHPRGRPQALPVLPVRGEDARPRARRRGTTTSWCRPPRPRKPSGR